MCCKHSCHCGGKHQHGHHRGGSCGCEQSHGFGSVFWTRTEKIAWLEEQLEGLREEVQAYEDRIAALKEEA